MIRINFREILNRIVFDLKKNATLLLVIFMAWAGIALIFHHFCPVVLLCGFPCPGCGLTRAFLSFITFHPIRAMQYNPSYPLWIAIAVVAFWKRYIKNSTLKSLEYPLLAVCIVTIVIYVWRLTHVFPGSAPMNYTHQNLFSFIHPEYDRLMTSLFR
ncbi:DUF2752 domain-containing protein [Butyrivibrio sp. XPD2002]|uniref:DUF2752 domain-containing protein n=1 Tax=Butyrivibrio sp. XPD2002 TaxID=1280665 RepID=UPI0004069A89|nr:DUF2752 domain-containing protein [Butyrivibrio sp. XPD2002]